MRRDRKKEAARHGVGRGGGTEIRKIDREDERYSR